MSSTPFEPADQSIPASASSTVQEFPRYADAQALVDKLSDAGFPVEHLRIVGMGIRTVEQITGRMTKGRAALAGAGTGAWFGLLFGLLFGLFSVGTSWLFIILWSVVLGAIWGAVFGFLAHWATRGQRDFRSVQGLEAERYAVMVDSTEHAEAMRLASA